jgi:hypothetical protein
MTIVSVVHLIALTTYWAGLNSYARLDFGYGPKNMIFFRHGVFFPWEYSSGCIQGGGSDRSDGRLFFQ